MNDYFGNKLEVGDKVISSHGGRCKVRHFVRIITRMSAKRIAVDGGLCNYKPDTLIKIGGDHENS